jgi:hypothetical protein
LCHYEKNYTVNLYIYRMDFFKKKEHIFIIVGLIICIILYIVHISQPSSVEIAEEAFIKEFEKQVNEQQPPKDDSKPPIQLPAAGPSELDKYFKEKKIESNKALARDLAIQLGPVIALRVAKTAIAKKAGLAAVRVSVRVLEKLVGKVSVDMLSKIGIRIARKVAVSAGGKLAAAAAKAASSGPAAIITLAFDAVSIGLDIADVGGYMQMGTKELYIAMRKEILEQYARAFAEQGIELPLVYGPLDKLMENIDEYNKKVNTEIELITSDINEPIMREYNKKNTEFIANNPNVTAKQIEEAFSNNFDKYVNIDKIMAKTTANLCVKNNGTMYGEYCTYKNPSDCKNSMIWPPTEESTYVEWDSEKKVCSIASNAMYDVCKSAHIGYNWETGLCDITEDYCKSKGAKWEYNDKIKQYDCKIPKSQEIFESIFGTTVTRGTIQIFDKDQYCPCPSDTREVPPYLCEKCPADHPIKKGAFCYDTCPSGMEDINLGCRQNIPNPDNFMKGAGGLTYIKKSMPVQLKPCNTWNSSYRDDGTSCWLDTYGNGVGKLPNTSCPNGWRSDGTSCWEDLVCKWNDCQSKGPLGNCWGGLDCTGCGCIKQGVVRSCDQGWTNVAGLCYKNCKPGYRFRGGNLCEPEGGPGIKKTKFDREFCPPGYKNVLGICWAECPPGFSDNGMGCNRPGYERSPHALITIPKSRKYAFSKKNNAVIKSGNC